MPDTCIVSGCKARREKGKMRAFYRFPSGKTPFELHRRQLWRQALRERAHCLTGYVCSAHFLSGELRKYVEK